MTSVTYTPLDITDKQRENMRTHAKWLTDNADRIQFDMSVYFDKRASPGDINCELYGHRCGTVACAAGWAVFNGLPEFELLDSEFFKQDTRSEPLIHFEEHSARVFGLDWSDDAIRGNCWKYAFDDWWGDIDNTAIGAAKRLRMLADQGLPSNWIAQINGDAPLSYDTNHLDNDPA